MTVWYFITCCEEVTSEDKIWDIHQAGLPLSQQEEQQKQQQEPPPKSKCGVLEVWNLTHKLQKLEWENRVSELDAF